MFSISRFVLRGALIGGLALGGLALFSPLTAKNFVHTVKDNAQAVADNFIDDPQALRRQLARLSEEYPDRIAEVKSEVIAVTNQLGDLEKDIQVAQHVVARTTDDLQDLEVLVTRAQDAQSSSARQVSLRFRGVTFDVEEAMSEAHNINNIRQSYKSRLANDQHQVEFLSEQKARLTEILDKLETDYNTYQTQLWALDRQIDAIERNERLIELTEQQQATLQQYEKFGKIGNLKQLESRLAELRTLQESQLESLKKQRLHLDYEEQAMYEMGTGDIHQNSSNPFADLDDVEDATDADDDVAMQTTNTRIAFADPIVIE
jgi:chromosome segregation ATPase